MTLSKGLQLKKEDRKRRRADERWRRYIQDLRRRQIQASLDRARRRRWLLALLLALLESTPMQMFFPSPDPAPTPAPPKTSPARKSQKKAAVETLSDYDRHYLFDHRPRRGEEHLEVYDGLTYSDIAAHRPRLSLKFQPIPGMPDRYRDEPVHIWTLLDHLGSDYHRRDAIKALKLLVDKSAHAWIDACAVGENGSSWRDLRLCRQRTPEMTVRDFPRMAAWWRESVRREAEAKIPDVDPKPPGLD